MAARQPRRRPNEGGRDQVRQHQQQANGGFRLHPRHCEDTAGEGSGGTQLVKLPLFPQRTSASGLSPADSSSEGAAAWAQNAAAGGAGRSANTAPLSADEERTARVRKISQEDQARKGEPPRSCSARLTRSPNARKLDIEADPVTACTGPRHVYSPLADSLPRTPQCPSELPQSAHFRIAGW